MFEGGLQKWSKMQEVQLYNAGVGVGTPQVTAPSEKPIFLINVD